MLLYPDLLKDILILFKVWVFAAQVEIYLRLPTIWDSRVQYIHETINKG